MPSLRVISTSEIQQIERPGEQQFNLACPIYSSIARPSNPHLQTFVKLLEFIFVCLKVSSRSRGMGGFKRVRSTRSTLRLVSSSEGEHTVQDPSSEQDQTGTFTRKAALVRRKSSQIMYERKLAFYWQLSQTVRVVRRMSQPSLTSPAGLQMAPSVASIAEEQRLEDAESGAGHAGRERLSGVQGGRADQEYCGETGDYVDDVFEANWADPKPSECERLRQYGQDTPGAKVDEADGRETGGDEGTTPPEINPFPDRVRKIFFAENADICPLDADGRGWEEDAATGSPEMNPPPDRVRKISVVKNPDICHLETFSDKPTLPDADPISVGAYRQLIDALAQSDEGNRDESGPSSVQDLLASYEAATETTL